MLSSNSFRQSSTTAEMWTIDPFRSISLFSCTSSGVVSCRFICSSFIFISYVNFMSEIHDFFLHWFLFLDMNIWNLVTCFFNHLLQLLLLLYFLIPLLDCLVKCVLQWSSLSLSLSTWIFNYKVSFSLFLSSSMISRCSLSIFEVALWWCSCSRTSTLWLAALPRRSQIARLRQVSTLSTPQV